MYSVPNWGQAHNTLWSFMKGPVCKDNDLVVACSGPRIRSVAGRHESSQVTRAKPTKAVDTWVVVKFMGLFLDP